MLGVMTSILWNKFGDDIAPGDHIEASINLIPTANGSRDCEISFVRNNGMTLLLGFGRNFEEALESASTRLADKNFGRLPKIAL